MVFGTSCATEITPEWNVTMSSLVDACQDSARYAGNVYFVQDTSVAAQDRVVRENSMTPLNPESILIVRPSALGDVCRTVPVLVSLKGKWPDARTGWLVQDNFVEAVSAHPCLDEVIPFPRSRMRSAWRSPKRMREVLGFLRTLQRSNWDLVLDCQGLARSSLFSRLSGSSRRVGFSDAREFGWLMMTDRVPTVSTHIVDRTMELVAHLGGEDKPDMRLHAPPECVEGWEASHLRPESAYVVLAPRSRWGTKEWPMNKWRGLIEGLAARGHRDFVLVGSHEERDSLEGLIGALDMRDGPRVVSMAGRTTVGDLMAIIRSAALVVANDSAALHVAVGFSRPMVGLFGPTDPREVGPYGALDQVIRHADARGSGHDYRSRSGPMDSMDRITVPEVLDRAIEVLEPGA